MDKYELASVACYRNTLVQRLVLYTDPKSHNTQRYRLTDRRTDRRHDDAIMPIADYTVQQYDRLKWHAWLIDWSHQIGELWKTTHLLFFQQRHSSLDIGTHDSVAIQRSAASRKHQYIVISLPTVVSRSAISSPHNEPVTATYPSIFICSKFHKAMTLIG